jgi:Fe2+ or Zn2+ uptake regulation protein
MRLRICGAVEDTEDCPLPSTAEIKRRYGFSPESHELEIYGKCRSCA